MTQAGEQAGTIGSGPGDPPPETALGLRILADHAGQDTEECHQETLNKTGAYAHDNHYDDYIT